MRIGVSFDTKETMLCLELHPIIGLAILIKHSHGWIPIIISADQTLRWTCTFF